MGKTTPCWHSARGPRFNMPLRSIPDPKPLTTAESLAMLARREIV
jgi:hypothetical protein